MAKIIKLKKQESNIEKTNPMVGALISTLQGIEKDLREHLNTSSPNLKKDTD